MEKTINHAAPKDEIHIRPINETNLYEVRILTDMAAGELKWHRPILESGELDPSRADKFLGFSVIQGPAGNEQLNFPIDATSITDALVKWPRELEKMILARNKAFAEAQHRAMLAQSSRPLPRQ